MAPPPRTRTPCYPRSLPALMEELVEEIVLRIPPDEPKHLFRAALVCKPWRRILTDPGFLRRYRAFHRAPPLLGYLNNLAHNNPAGIPPFSRTSPLSPLSTTLPELESSSWVLDCRHGRVLIHTFRGSLVVWDPITGSKKKLSLPNYEHEQYAGAVLCAVDGCDHLDCHDGPFLVVFAGSGHDGYEFDTGVVVYSSEAGQWFAPITIQEDCFLTNKPPLLIRDTLYFRAENTEYCKIILKFDLGAHELSVIDPPGGFWHGQEILMEVDGGGLGFVTIEDNSLHMLSWHGNVNNGTGGEWAQHLVKELKTDLPKSPFPCNDELVGLLEGTNTVFISVPGVGLFTLDLKSWKVKKVGERGAYYAVVPYTGFYTPDLTKGTRHQLHEDAMIDLPT